VGSFRKENVGAFISSIEEEGSGRALPIVDVAGHVCIAKAIGHHGVGAAVIDRVSNVPK
jgi:hypothetical protein